MRAADVIQTIKFDSPLKIIPSDTGFRKDRGVRAFKWHKDQPPDVVIFGKNWVWHAHKEVLCAKSGWFRAVLSEPHMKSVVPMFNLEDEDAFAVEGLLLLLYTDGFFRNVHSVILPEPSMAATTMAKLVLICSIAEKHDARGLIPGLIWDIHKYAISNWDVKVYVRAVDRLWADEQVTGVRKELCGKLISVGSFHAKELLARDDFSQSLRTRPAFARDLFQYVGGWDLE